MIKKSLFIFLNLLFANCSINKPEKSEQNVASVTIFRTIHFNPFDGKPERESFDTIDKHPVKVDWSLLRSKYGFLRILPEKFIDSSYRNESVKDTAKGGNARDLLTSYGYDSLSRLVYFGQGGFLCNMPHSYFIQYNNANRPVKILNSINDKSVYSFTYNAEGEINLIEYYTSGQLSDRIIRIK